MCPLTEAKLFFPQFSSIYRSVFPKSSLRLFFFHFTTHLKHILDYLAFSFLAICPYILIVVSPLAFPIRSPYNLSHVSTQSRRKTIHLKYLLSMVSFIYYYFLRFLFSVQASELYGAIFSINDLIVYIFAVFFIILLRLVCYHSSTSRFS